MISNPTIRQALYAVQMILGGVVVLLAIFGVLDQDTAGQIVTAIGGLVALAAGGVASSNVNPKPATITSDGVAVITDALEAYAERTIPAVLTTAASSAATAVDRARAELEQRLGR